MSMPIRPLAIVFVLVFLTVSSIIMAGPVSGASAAGNTWVEKAPMTVARSNLGVAAVNGKIYAIGGSTASGSEPSIPPSVAYNIEGIGGFVGTNEEYNPETDKWTYKAFMPTPRMSFAIAVVNNKIYCIGGRTTAAGSVGGYTAVNEVYDPATDTWETKAPLPTAAAWLVGSVVENKIHLIADFQTHYVYDPVNDSWTTKASQSVSYYVSAVSDKKIYLLDYIQRFVIYDSETDNWSLGPSPPSSNAGGAAAATTGVNSPKRVYVFGEKANLEQGENPGFVRIYDPQNNGWTYGADPNHGYRYNFGVAVLNDTFYVIGGHTYNFLGDFAPTAVNEQYTPIGYGAPDPSYVLEHTPPQILFDSPPNKTYINSTVSVTFCVDKGITMASYSLDGQQNVTITGNTTLTGLSNGLHNVTVYANDTFGNTGSSTITFTVATPEPDDFPVVPVTAVTTVIIATIIGLVLYSRKRRRYGSV